MSWIEINTKPTARELLVFGWLLVAFAGLFGLTLRLRFAAPTAGWIVWGVGAVVAGAFFLLPALRRPVYLGSMYLALPIGFVMSHVLVGLVFFVVLTPIGLGMRLLGRDTLGRKLDPGARTYWVEHDPHRDPRRYFRQF